MDEETKVVETPWLKNYEDGVPPSLVYPQVPLTHFLQDRADSDIRPSELARESGTGTRTL